jgi:hypothetical protein
MGSGLMVGWFLLSLLYLAAAEKRKPLRVLLVYVPVSLLLLFFNPWMADFFYRYVQDAEIYYRILWLIPMTAEIAYAAARIFTGLRGKKKALFAVAGTVVLMLSGSFIYADPYFQKAQNLYHMPQSMVGICDAIEVEGREVMAVFPEEFLQFVRQYAPTVCMPYGREMLLQLWGNYDPLHTAMEAAVIDVAELVRLAREDGCHYIILRREKPKHGKFEDYGYRLFESIDDYDIYLDGTQRL